MSNSKRFVELDVIRGIAALSVVLFHYTTRFDQIYGHSDRLLISFPLGHYGVQLFFIVSGFVIFMTLEKTKNGLDFIVSRFSRLYPAYWVAVVITFIAVYIAALPGRQVSLGAAAINLSMLQSFMRIPYVDGVYWTLAIELCFYAIMFGLFKARLLQHIHSTSFVWLLLIISTSILERYTGLAVPGMVRTILILDYANLFVAGIMFYQIMERGHSVRAYTIIALALIAQAFVSSGEAIAITGAFFLVFFAAAQGWLGFISKRPLIFLGMLTYTLYLVHQNIGYVIIRALYKLGLDPNLSVLVAIAFSISLASAITFFVEKPALNALRDWYRKTRKVHLATIPAQAGNE